MILILVIAVPFAIVGILKQNLFPVITLASVLIVSMILCPDLYQRSPIRQGP